MVDFSSHVCPKENISPKWNSNFSNCTRKYPEIRYTHPSEKLNYRRDVDAAEETRRHRRKIRDARLDSQNSHSKPSGEEK